MKNLQNIYWLVSKELKLELRNKHALGGLLLYAVSTVFVIYIAFDEINPTAWISTWWIVMLFASVSAVAKSFLQENEARHIYYYTTLSPIDLIFSKLIYNFILLSFIAALTLLAFVFVLGDPVEHWSSFLGVLFLGVLSFSSAFTLVSAITSRAGQNVTMMAILSIPIVIPILIILVQLSMASVNALTDLNWFKNYGILLAINGILILLSYLLFPYIWRD